MAAMVFASFVYQGCFGRRHCAIIATIQEILTLRNISMISLAFPKNYIDILSVASSISSSKILIFGVKPSNGDPFLRKILLITQHVFSVFAALAGE